MIYAHFNKTNINSRCVAKILVRGKKHQTKLSVMLPEFQFGAVTLSKNLFNKKVFKTFDYF